MGNTENSDQKSPEGTDYKKFVSKRVVFGFLAMIVVLWVGWTILGLFEGSPSVKIAETAHSDTLKIPSDSGTAHGPLPPAVHKKAAAPSATDAAAGHAPEKKTAAAAGHSPATEGAVAKTGHGAVSLGSSIKRPLGVAFVAAVIEPLDYELHERFWGWRPNDILDFTDNVNNFQRGVLEVTRRAVIQLTDRISRTGSTATLDPNLERAMNWFMVKSDRYWFPSPESSYKDGLRELAAYKNKLEKREANFYTRSDNLIPLLTAFENLLGSCDQNLVKTHEEDGKTVSYFTADNYFYYAKGVASALHPILEAIMIDFEPTLENRNGVELLHHAIESCRRAIEISPWLVTEASLSGILANHRANMAAPISHARFYIGALITTLST